METQTVKTHCMLCKKESSLVVNKASFDKWQAGELIQNAIPELTASEREQLISGTCELCWETYFNEE
jgi:hypothetical protein